MSVDTRISTANAMVCKRCVLYFHTCAYCGHIRSMLIVNGWTRFKTCYSVSFVVKNIHGCRHAFHPAVSICFEVIAH